jgi:hypothetical protein
MEITKEQVLDIYGTTGNLYLHSKLEKWFPEAFKTTLEIGKVYKYKGLKTLVKIETINAEYFKVYGFDCEGNYCRWNDYENFNDDKWQEATTEEWESALIEEAKKRGYKNGNYECLYHYGDSRKTDGNIHMFEGCVWIGKRGELNQIFKNGIWAEIIKTFSKEEAEELLGGKII